jgi:hypothetical protein
MNKVKPCVLLLSAIIGIENNRLEQLALDQSHSIDLTSDYSHSPYEILIKECISFTLPNIFNSIQSLSINLKHLPRLFHTFKIIDAEKWLNLKHLKIMEGRLTSHTGTPYTIGKLYSLFCSFKVNLVQDLILSKTSYTEETVFILYYTVNT